eukprot:5764903-Amphidinium_carterae.1
MNLWHAGKIPTIYFVVCWLVSADASIESSLSNHEQGNGSPPPSTLQLDTCSTCNKLDSV